MSDREKLIEILMSKPYGHSTYEEMADYLISNGVTVQKWIPVSERLPENAQEVIVYVGNVQKPYVLSTIFWSEKYFGWENVTHWMPLPEPPKECE